ncbi:ABC transporter ATP-binding protein [Roseobacter sp. MED193]|uniref:ABC transporter ATP-binding protein n=1 Tax=Roseobacter sp. MED193 TaxID=314262 RepID=UPI000068E06B|nr:sn-glycerol-3-phosphate ABC transporter ATP-binding protein UgpC [Roseobacter sp. MED193]EAQ45605.1 ABC transporter ATP-binding protein [Roseobacter sp. MED193]
MANVTIDNVIKRYGAAQVMHGVSVDIKDGEFVVLVGPSGCGKSTLLRMLAGLEEVSEGTISIGGRVVNDVLPKERDIAMVFQSYALYPHKTVSQNIGFPLLMAKRSKAEIAEKVKSAAEILDLTKYLDRYPKELSGGQRQRVAMGRAIVRDPQVFLFDEPLSNLDAKLRVTMRIEIKELHQRLGTTIVYVTHDQVEAMTMADKIVVMRDGRVEQIGSPLDLYDNPVNTFVAGFIGSPSMNFVHGKIASIGGSRVFQSDSGLNLPLPQTRAVEGQTVTFGVRPECVRVGEGGVEMEIVAVEPTGSETQIFARSGSDLIDALVKERISARPGSKLGFVFDPEDVHLFDSKTGQHI